MWPYRGQNKYGHEWAHNECGHEYKLHIRKWYSVRSPYRDFRVDNRKSNCRKNV